MHMQDLSYEQLMELSERLGEVGNGADEESINRHTAEAKYEGATEGVEVPTCTVCMSDFEVAVLACGWVNLIAVAVRRGMNCVYYRVVTSTTRHAWTSGCR